MSTAKFDDFVIQSPADLPSAAIRRGETIDELDTILSSAPYVSVLAWLYHDDRAFRWKTESKKWGVLGILPKGCHYYRESSEPIPSYAHWCISRKKWLPTTEGKTVSPAECLLGERAIESLFPRPAAPDSDTAQEFGLDGRRLSEAFQNAGVAAGLAHFSKDELYRLLMEMPTRSPDGKAARGLYRWLLQNDHVLYGRTGEQYREFRKSGLMWGSKNGEADYFAVKDLRHADGDGLPDALIKQVCLVDLPRRVGADKVERIFGVDSIERSGIQHSVVRKRQNPSTDRQAGNFNAAKPYIRRLRQSQSSRAEFLSAFERLQLCLCDELVVCLRYEESESDYSAPEWEWVIDEDIIYVRTDFDADADLLADALGAALASVFRVADGDGFAKLIRCKEKSRNQLLRKMCGDALHEEVEAAHGRHKANSVYKGPIEKPEQREPEETLIELGSEDVDSSSDEDAENGVDFTETIPVVEQQEHVPAERSLPRRVAIKKIVGTRKTRVVMSVTDGDLCERKAMEFEQNGILERYPVSVGHITGFEAPGVDILSFNNDADRQRFINVDTRDVALVDRFIEVKGRANPSAKIELKGNELKKAQEEGAKYYIYRVFKDEKGYLISALRNPLECDEAITNAVWVDLDRAETTERYVMRDEDVEP